MSGTSPVARRRRGTVATVAGLLAVVLMVDPFALGSVAPAVADDLGSRSDNFDDVLASLGLDSAAAAADITGDWDALPGAGSLEALPAEMPEEDEEVVVLTEEEGGGTGPAALGLLTEDPPAPPAPVEVEVGGIEFTVAAADPEDTPSAVLLRVAGDEETADAGITGVLLEVSDASETPYTGSAEVELTVSYETFAGLVGSADWASRLRFVWIPECDPEEYCSPTAITTVNDPVAQTVTATVPVLPAEETEPAMALASTSAPGSRATGGGGGGGSLGITAGASGSQGNWGATSLAAASTWGAAGSSGGFTWSMALPVPSAGIGPSPQLALSYSSAASDGRIPSSNNQSGWVGEGFSLTSGYVERSYIPCSEDEDGSPNNVDRVSGDLCWGKENATLVFNGSAVELIRDETTGEWHAKNDDGSKIERITGSSWNGGQQDEYWKVTTTDGTQYFFGRGKRSSSDAALNSAWTVPVYGNHSGEPCYHATGSGGFSDSDCTQVWRWNLEYVVDPSGNSMTYFYAQESNEYVFDVEDNFDGDTVSYTSGGRLDRIEYGTRFGEESSGSAPAKVTFTAPPRCITDVEDADSFCTTGQTSTESNEWLDSPTDLVCTSSMDPGDCENYTPVFFDRHRLSTVTTFAFDGTAYQKIDSWAFGQTFDPEGTGGGLEFASSAVLALNSITHTGHAGTATTADDLALPPIVFGYTDLANRVDTGPEGHPPFDRPRVSHIRTDSGAGVNVNYDTECGPGDIPGTGETEQQNNTRLCFPVKWYPNQGGDPIVEYFHKYVVASIVESGAAPVPEGEGELITGSLDKVTTFEYGGDPVWKKPTGGMVKASELTYSDFRGFESVTTTVGLGDESSVTRNVYFQGAGGQLTEGPTGFTVTVDDLERYQGQVFASYQYNGEMVISAAVTQPGVPVQVAENTAGVKSTRLPSSTAYGFTFGTVSNPTYRTKTVTTYNAYSQVVAIDDQGDVTSPFDNLCTTVTYAHESNSGLASAYLVSLVSQKRVVSRLCSQTPTLPADLVSNDTATYDAQGRVLRSERLDPTDGVGQVLVREVLDYDAQGRPLEFVDALGQVSTTEYGMSSGGMPESVTSTTTDPDGSGPLSGFESTTELNSLTGWVTAMIDANGKVTSGEYDALGRLVEVRLPQHAGLTTPSIEYEYVVDPNGLNAVLTRTLGADGESQHVNVTLYDGLLRVFQSQAEGLDAGADHDADAAERGRMVAHTYYDSAGRVATQTSEWWAEDAPSTTPIVPVAVPPSQTTFEYDAGGRPTAEIFWIGTDSEPTNEQWRTTTIYDDYSTFSIPPVGGTPTETTLDARGRMLQLREYLRDPDTDAAADTIDELLQLETGSLTTYVYDGAGRLSELLDSVDNSWTYEYDWAGRQIEAVDPDAGTTTTTYDVLDRVVTRTNGNGDTLAYTYDGLGRVTTLRDDSPTGGIRAAWTYDASLDEDDDPVLGQPSSSTRFVGGEAYTTSTPLYDDAYRPLETVLTLPDLPEFTELDSLSYTTRYVYTADGQVASVSLPSVVDSDDDKVLGAETVTTRYDTASMPSWMSGGFGWGTYVAESRFAADGRAVAADLGNTYGAVVSYGYEDGTNRLTGIALTRQAYGVAVDLAYAYDDAGNVLSVKDQASATASLQDNQCFGYDGLRRLEVAWTDGNGDCVPAGSSVQVSDVGGVEPYWTSYEYDYLSSRTAMTEHIVGGVSVEVSTAYDHASSPHQVTSATESVTGLPPATTTYAYDDAGNRVSMTANSVTTDFVWDAEGELVGVDGEEYVYDASGSRVVRSAADGVTVYLPGGQEITIDNGGEVSASRYYSFAGQTVATRTGAGLGGVTSLVADHHGSVIAAIPNTEWTASSVARVFWDPFGGIRGDSDGDVPGDHRFLGAPSDVDSGLTLLGARYYDSVLGRFISVDPVLDPAIPAQFNAYVYSWNNPVTFSDPSGLTPAGKSKGTPPGKPNPPAGNPNSVDSVESLLEWLVQNSGAVENTQYPGAVWQYGLNVGGFDYVGDGEYHTRPDAWQLILGYNDGYDVLFDLGTDMDRDKFVFEYEETSYVIWMWKGDYLNLGAGAELGFYTGDGGLREALGQWDAVTSSLVPEMTLTLRGASGDTIASFAPDDPQVWVGGFNSRVQDPSADDLSAEYTVTFPNSDMYDAFRTSKAIRDSDYEWGWNGASRTATVRWRRRKR